MSLSKNIIKYQDVYLTIIFGVMIAYGTLFPLEKLPPVPGSDKWKHFLAFGVFVFPVCVFRSKWTWLICLTGVFYGGLIEFIQPYVNRYREMGDFWANTGGVVTGFLIARMVLFMKAKRFDVND